MSIYPAFTACIASLVLTLPACLSTPTFESGDLGSGDALVSVDSDTGQEVGGPDADAIADADVPDADAIADADGADADAADADAADADAIADADVDVADTDAMADADAADADVADADAIADADAEIPDVDPEIPDVDIEVVACSPSGELTFPATELTFPASYAGARTGPNNVRLVVLRNLSPTDVHCIDVSIAGAFEFVGDSYPGAAGSCGTSLPAGQSCTMEVAYRTPVPEGSSPDTGSLSVSYGTNGIVVLPLSGQARMMTQLDLGFLASCGVLNTGSVACWGDNYWKSLGLAAGDTDPSPIQLADALPPSDIFTQVAVGFLHACALRSDGAVFCWGANDAALVAEGYLGGADALPSFHFGALLGHTNCSDCPPSPVPALDGTTSGAISIEAGDFHTCAIVDDGTPLDGGPVVCWGVNDTYFFEDQTNHAQGSAGGVLGLPSTTLGAVEPAEVVGLTDIVALDASRTHTCALRATGEMLCWGANLFGELGDGTQTSSHLPVTVNLGGTVVAMATASATNEYTPSASTCAIRDGGSTRCWGGDTYGELGNGFAGSLVDPSGSGAQDVDAAGPLTRIAGGRTSYCGIDADDKVFCWGSQNMGETGGGTFSNQGLQTPNLVETGAKVALSVAGLRACAVGADGAIHCWGRNDGGVMGNANEVEAQASPVGLARAPGEVVAVAAGESHTCGLLNTGVVRCWGSNELGQILSGPAVAPDAVAIDGLEPARLIAAGANHTCAAADNGQLKCWGDQGQFQFVDAVSSQAGIFTLPISATRSLAAGGNVTCAVDTAGTVRCSGNSSYGQTGAVGNLVVDLPGPARKVAVGARHACAMLANGELWCWGSNTTGEISADGSSDEDLLPPTLVPAPTEVDQIHAVVAGDGLTCAAYGTGLDKPDVVHCWGFNYTGVIAGAPNPAPTTPMFDAFGAIAVGGLTLGAGHVCACSGDRLQCVGNNNDWPLDGGGGGGQIGADPALVQSSATPVVYEPGGFQGSTDAGCVGVSAGLVHTCMVLSDGIVNCMGVHSTGPFGKGQLGIGDVDGAMIYSGPPWPLAGDVWRPIGVSRVY